MKKIFLLILLFLLLMTLSACGEYTISFNTNGGEEMSPITLKKGEEINIKDPEKDNFAFDGWYKDPEFTLPFTYNSMPSKSLNLYAKWKPCYTLKVYNDFNNYETISIKEGAPLILNEPTRENYVFCGWFLDSEFNEALPQDLFATQNMDIYAKWVPYSLGININTFDFSLYYPQINHSDTEKILNDFLPDGVEEAELNYSNGINGFGIANDNDSLLIPNGFVIITFKCNNNTLADTYAENILGELENKFNDIDDNPYKTGYLINSSENNINMYIMLRLKSLPEILLEDDYIKDNATLNYFKIMGDQVNLSIESSVTPEDFQDYLNNLGIFKTIEIGNQSTFEDNQITKYSFNLIINLKDIEFDLNKELIFTDISNLTDFSVGPSVFIKIEHYIMFPSFLISLPIEENVTINILEKDYEYEYKYYKITLNEFRLTDNEIENLYNTIDALSKLNYIVIEKLEFNPTSQEGTIVLKIFQRIT